MASERLTEADEAIIRCDDREWQAREMHQGPQSAPIGWHRGFDRRKLLGELDATRADLAAAKAECKRVKGERDEAFARGFRWGLDDALNAIDEADTWNEEEMCCARVVVETCENAIRQITAPEQKGPSK